MKKTKRPALTKTNVRKVLETAMKTIGVKSTVEILKLFKAKRLSEVDKKDYRSLIAACEYEVNSQTSFLS